MLTTMYISQAGARHIARGVECQDASYAEVIKTPYGGNFAIGAIGDGVGSCLFSSTGSRIVVETGSASIINKLLSCDNMPSEDQMREMLNEAFQQALNSIIEYADNECLSPALFETTLTIAVYHEESRKLYWCHAGDDGIVALFDDASYRMVTKRHNGESVNIVVPLSQHQWEFGCENNVVAVTMLTDGLLDNYVDNEFHNNRVYWPFFREAMLAQVKTKEDADEVNEAWMEWLSSEDDDSIRQIVGDDLSIVVITNQDALKDLKPVRFSEDEWNEQSKRFHSPEGSEDALQSTAMKTAEVEKSGNNTSVFDKLKQFAHKLFSSRKLRCFGIVSGIKYICEQDPVRSDTFKTNYPDLYLRLVSNPAEKVQAAINGCEACFPSAEGHPVIDLACTAEAGYIGYIFTMKEA